MSPPIVIADPAALRTFCERARGAVFCAVDTEFFWERTYFPALSLIQVAVADAVAVVDVLAVADLAPLRELLLAPATVKVFHSASQDLFVLRRALGACPAPVLDTQIAAALVGERHQIGYAELVQSRLGVTLSKEHQRTDWLTRPLAPERVAYAGDDVRFLVTLYEGLAAQLAALGRRPWAEEDSAWMATHLPEETVPPSEAWQAIEGYGRLNARQLLGLRELAAWRERTGRERDLRPRLLVPDRVLLEMARHGAFHPRMLAGLYRSASRRVTDCLPQMEPILAAAAALPEDHLPRVAQNRRLTPREKEAVERAGKVVAERAKTLGIERCMLATNSQLLHLVRQVSERPGAVDSRLVEGWRGAEVGSAVLRAVTEALAASPA
ncbi:MAG: Ribonuclease D [Lentisphaerae bacterium ADurb.BinA184]|nr:MAG: Ribonuclease D [Lentisphaerae bacterium ADurb.BinA184]